MLQIYQMRYIHANLERFIYEKYIISDIFYKFVKKYYA